MTNAPIGVPSGWEEIAAWNAYEFEWAWDMLARVLDALTIPPGAFSEENHDWRVEE